MIWYLGAVHSEAMHKGFVFTVPYDDAKFFDIPEGDVNRECHSVSFVDDMAVPIIGKSRQIIPKLQELVQILYTYAWIFHFKLNFKVGKTQPMI